MRTFDPGFLEMSPQSEEWRKEHEQLIARVTVATAFTRKYPGMYEQLQESFKSINPPPPPPQPADSDLDDGPAPYTGQYL